MAHETSVKGAMKSEKMGLVRKAIKSSFYKSFKQIYENYSVGQFSGKKGFFKVFRWRCYLGIDCGDSRQSALNLDFKQGIN